MQETGRKSFAILEILTFGSQINRMMGADDSHINRVNRENDRVSFVNGTVSLEIGKVISRNSTESSEIGKASLRNGTANLKNGKAIWRKVTANLNTGKSRLKC